MQDPSASTSARPMTIGGVEAETDHRAVLAVGGSAGSVQPLLEIVRGLPGDLAAAVLVTIHVGEQTRLPQILSRSGPLQATHVRDREVLENGRIYIAPPGQHLLARSGLALLTPSPRVNRHRPAVDVMFASAAEWMAPRIVAVVLSGALDDGAVGAALVAQAGGQVLVQDPAEAEFASMPRSALAAAPGARAVPVGQLAQAVCDSLDVAQSLRSDPAPHEARMRADMGMVQSDDPGYLRADESRLSRLTCPDCGGSMAQVDLPQISYFRCHVGHQFSPQAFAAAQAEVSEKKLWGAVAALEEQSTVLRYVQRIASRQRQVALPDQDQTSPAQERYVEEVASRALALRAQVREWSRHPPQLDTPPE
jgi:two-component system, chemotaxis family, protein-glutamate methylesterase/glutaminase